MKTTANDSRIIHRIIEPLASVALAAMGIVTILLALSGCHAAPAQPEEGALSVPPPLTELATSGILPFDVGTDPVTTPQDTEPPEATGWCAEVEFPPANEPDGCARRLLTMDAAGNPFNASSRDVTIARNGKLAVFTVLPTEEFGVNGLAADDNLAGDIYAARIEADEAPLELLSVNNEGKVGDGDSFEPSVGAEGARVAFTSYAGNLTDEDSDGYAAVFVRDRHQHKTRRVSVTLEGDAPNGDSYAPVISGEGRFVAFLSAASNLVADDENGQVDLFVRDLEEGITERISLTAEGEEPQEAAGAPAGISDDGRYVLFTHPSRLERADTESDDQPLRERRDAYVYDRLERTPRLITVAKTGQNVRGVRAVAMSPKGNRVLVQVADGAALHGLEVDRQPATVLFHLDVDEPEPELQLVKMGRGRAAAMDDAGYTVAFSSRETGLVDSVALGPEDIAVDNAYALDLHTAEVQLLTAAENGTPAVLHAYDDEVADQDWVEVAMSGSGQRFVLSSIQYGIVDHAALHCKNYRPRLVYLVDCSL